MLEDMELILLLTLIRQINFRDGSSKLELTFRNVDQTLLLSDQQLILLYMMLPSSVDLLKTITQISRTDYDHEEEKIAI
jgi:hypothetical protein